MNLDDLRHFEHLAQTLHFGRCAKERALSASALTRRIQAIEAAVGQTLLIRDQRHVQLTAAGRMFRQYAQRQLDQWEELQNAFGRERQAPTGTLKIACTVTACYTILPTLLAQFRKRFPDVTLRLLTQAAGLSRAQLEAKELDLAVVPTEPRQVDGLSVKKLASTRLVFIAPKNLSLLGATAGPIRGITRASDIAELPLVAPIGGLERERLDEWLSSRKVVPQIAAEVRGNEGVLAMVSLGSGIGIVPELVLASSPLHQSVQVLEGLTPPRGYQVSLCARAKSLERRIVEVFWNVAEELVRPRSA